MIQNTPAAAHRHVSGIVLTLAALFLLPCMTLAQSINLSTYYASADGKKQAELKTAMYHIIGNPDVKSYGSLWTYYYQTDRLADNQVVDRYSNEKHYFTGQTGTAVSGMNREHGIPKSWWGGGGTAASDLHHVMPSESDANSRKSNYGMGVVTSESWTNGSIKVGKGTAGNNGTVQLWEPADEWKGDFARIYFYIVTCYEELSMVQQQGANTMQANTYPKLQPWASQLYLRWAREDPVSDLERERNEVVYELQGNRNPFIDYPSLAEYIWGDSISYAFSVGNTHTIDPDPEPDPDPTPTVGAIVFSQLTWTADTHATYGQGFTTTVNGITVGYYKNQSTVAPIEPKSELRFYDKCVLIIEGAEMTSVTFYDAGDSKSGCSITIDDQDYTFGTAGSFTWTGNTSTLVCHANKQSRLSSIDVTLKDGTPATETTAADHYRTVQGLNQARLKNALHDIIQPQTVLAYGGKGEGYTWAGFAKADTMPGGVIVRDRYSSVERNLRGTQAVDGMHIEHIWANSWWGHTVNNAYCDLFNLFPADAEANQRKSNNPIGIVDGNVAFDNGVTRVGTSSSYRADSLITAWEPADEWKGDFARTYFYMATAYQHMSSEWQTTEGLLTIDPASWQTMRPWVAEMMLTWAAEDPVDDIERARNEVLYGIQGNRNPYIDCPELASYVWGDTGDEVFYVDPASSKPEVFIPVAGTPIDCGLQALSRGLSRNITVRGRNLPTGLTATLVGDGFAMDDTQLTAAEVTAGSTLNITSSATAPGTYEATLVIASPGIYEQRTPLRMTLIDGIPAYDARNIVCTVTNRSFTASWMDMQLAEDAAYTIDVYTKDDDGTRHSLSNYPAAVADTFCVVRNTAAATTYYYQVTADGLTSNEVEVAMPELTPVFAASASSLTFTTTPGKASQAQTVKLTVLGKSGYAISVVCPEPFEASTDGETWSHELTLTASQLELLVRLSGNTSEGEYEDEMTISLPDVKDIIIALTASVDASKAFFESFETGSKNSYATATVTCNAATWEMVNALLAADANSNDKRSVRMKIGGSLTMTDDKVGGCDSLWFYAGLYNKDTDVTLTVSYSTDGGTSWTPVVSNLAFTSGEWRRYGYEIKRDGAIRLRLETPAGTQNKRINLDDIQMSDFGTSDDIATPATDGLTTNASTHAQVYTLDGRLIGSNVPTQHGVNILRRSNGVATKAVR